MWAVTGGGLLVVAVMVALYLAVPDFRRFEGPTSGDT
jgi:hypothetical protein